MAYASLLQDGYSVRLSGQDSGRGTFFTLDTQFLQIQQMSGKFLPLNEVTNFLKINLKFSILSL